MNWKKPVKRIISLFSEKSIIFESLPDFSDNTRAIYDEMVKRGYDKKYNLFWFVDYNKAASLVDGTPFYWNPKKHDTIDELRRYLSYYFGRVCTITCNRFISKRVDEIAVDLTHGSLIKDVRDYYYTPEYYDYVIAQSEMLAKVIKNVGNKDRIKVLGLPRNDVFARRDRVDICKLIGVNNKKIIMWYPTYRQHKNGVKTGSKNALPIIHNPENAIEIDKILEENATIILLKPHFAQDTSKIQSLNLKNIWIINDEFYTKHNILPYVFLHGCDALLTDYSSVYYDYTLSDHPIGVVLEDIDEYRENPGFAVNTDFWLKGAQKIYTCTDLCDFIVDVAEGIDRFKTERQEIRDYANVSTDGNNAKRVVDFLEKNVKL